MSVRDPEPQQQAASPPQPVIVVVNPTAWDNMRRYECLTKRAYLNRGALFSNGCRCYLPHIIVLCTLGTFFLFIGLSIITVGVTTGAFILTVGGILVALGLYFIRTARKQYNRLPSDHPDRIKYASMNPHYAAVSGPVMYTVQNQVMANPAVTGGQAYLMPLPPGAYMPPPSVGPHHNQVPLIFPAGHTMQQSTYNPEDDPPPAYVDVVRNEC